MADFEQADANDFSIFDAPDEQIRAEIAGKTTFGESEAETAVVDETTQERVVEDVLNAKSDTADVPESKPQEEKVPAKEETATAPKTHAPADDDLITIKQDGKDVAVRWGDYKGGVMRQADYTRKMQKVSERTSQIEEAATLLQEREGKFLDIASDPEKLAKLYHRLTGQPIPAASAVTKEEKTPAANADELVTMGDIHRTRDEVLSEVDQRARATVERALAEVQEQHAELARQTFIADMVSVTDETLDAVLKDHAETLGDIPYVDSIIKKLAWQDHQPKTLDDVRKAIVEAGKKLSAQFGTRRLEQKKVEVVKKTALDKGIESGGTAPGRAPKTYVKKHADGREDIDWDDLDKDVVGWIESSRR